MLYNNSIKGVQSNVRTNDKILSNLHLNHIIIFKIPYFFITSCFLLPLPSLSPYLQMNDIVEASQSSTRELQEQIDIYKEKNRRELAELQKLLKERGQELEKYLVTTKTLQNEVNTVRRNDTVARSRLLSVSLSEQFHADQHIMSYCSESASSSTPTNINLYFQRVMSALRYLCSPLPFQTQSIILKWKNLANSSNRKALFVCDPLALFLVVQFIIVSSLECEECFWWKRIIYVEMSLP